MHPLGRSGIYLSYLRANVSLNYSLFSENASPSKRRTFNHPEAPLSHAGEIVRVGYVKVVDKAIRKHILT